MDNLTYLYDRLPQGLAQAFGAFYINWNAAESSLNSLVVHFLGAHTYEIVHGMTNRMRIELLKRSVSVQEFSEKTKGTIENFIRVYDICAETRNIIAHGRLVPEATQILLIKRTGAKVSKYIVDESIILGYSNVARSLFHSGINIWEHLKSLAEKRAPIALLDVSPIPSKLRFVS